MDSTIRKFSKGYFLVILGFIWLILLVEVFENGSTRMNYVHQGGEGIMKNSKVFMKKRSTTSHVHPKIDHFNLVNKRRVPNGPDPIHNRRARSSRRPPGQASKGKLNIKP